MRRELKFRAWDDTNHYYFYNVAIYPDNVAGVQRHNIESEMLKAEYGATHWTELGENAVIEQYTGLKDKNGKEIYEGDIIRFNYLNVVVDWDNDFCSYCLKDKSLGARVRKFFLLSEDENEVIGNIHENPELLK